MINLSEIDVRTVEHELRVNRANRDGWLQSSAHRAGRQSRFGAVLDAVASRLAPGPSARPATVSVTTLDALASNNGSPSLA
jgi:hypothetical protein